MSLRQQKFSFLSHRLLSIVKALYWNLLSKCTKMRIFKSNFAKFSCGHAPGSHRIVVPSALPLKLICDVTRLWRHFNTLSEIFCVCHWIHLFSTPAYSTRRGSRFSGIRMTFPVHLSWRSAMMASIERQWARWRISTWGSMSHQCSLSILWRQEMWNCSRVLMWRPYRTQASQP